MDNYLPENMKGFTPDELDVAKRVFDSLTPMQKLGMSDAKPMLVEWDITSRPVTIEDGKEVVGDIEHTSHGHNLVVNAGRTNLISMAFCPTASSIGGWYYLGVGASSTAAAVTDTRLTYELIGNATRKTLLDVNNLTPQTGDIQTQAISISGCNFYQFIVLQATYTTTDGNNNNTFAEYGLFTVAALPSSPTGLSGSMFNHFIDPNPAFKSTTNQVLVQITLRF